MKLHFFSNFRTLCVKQFVENYWILKNYFFPPRFSDFTEQSLLNYGDFIVQQIESFEQAAAADEKTILESPALKKLCEVSNADSSLIKSRTERAQRFHKRQNRKPEDDDVDYIFVSSSEDEDDDYDPSSISRKNKSFKKPPPPMASKASTTPLGKKYALKIYDQLALYTSYILVGQKI